MGHSAFNTIGLTQILAYPVAGTSAAAGREPSRQRFIYIVQLCTVLPLTAFWFAARSRRENDLDAMVMTMVLIFAGLNLACYYYLMQILLIFPNRNRPDRLALLFAVEAGTYALLLFEDRDVVIYLYRNLLVLFLLLALYLDPLRVEARKAGRLASR